MKKACTICIIVFLVAILTFVITLFSPVTDSTRWRMFSITMPIIGSSFGLGIILAIIDFVRSKK